MLLKKLQAFDRATVTQEEILAQEIDDVNNALALTDQQYFTTTLSGAGFHRKASAVCEANRLQQLRSKNVGNYPLVSIRALRHACTVFRLRFLSTRHYTGSVPAEAVRQIAKFTETFKESHNQLLPDASNFYICAPAEVFELRTRAEVDPILLYLLSDDTYMVIAKWGNDLSWFRAILMYPFRTWFTYLTVFMIDLAFAVWGIVATEHYTGVVPAVFTFFLFVVYALNGVGMHADRKFSSMNWNSAIK